jgi:hypothetical protein
MQPPNSWKQSPAESRKLIISWRILQRADIRNAAEKTSLMVLC